MKRYIVLGSLLLGTYLFSNNTIQLDTNKVLTVRDLKGNTYKIAGLNGNSTVRELKEAVEKESGYPVELQKLIAYGKVVDDYTPYVYTPYGYTFSDYILSDYNLFDNDNLVIHLVLRPLIVHGPDCQCKHKVMYK